MVKTINSKSLNQGDLFNKISNKCKNKGVEGLDNMNTNTNTNVLQDERNRNKATIKQNDKDIEELMQMQKTFDELVVEYNKSYAVMKGDSLSNIARTSAQNPYLNKYIKWADNGTIMYVNSQGTAKPYNSADIYKSTLGVNGCPDKSSIIIVDIPWTTDYTVPGQIIPLTPSLVVGTPMTSNETCSYAGKNVYASSLINNPTATYMGCYNNQPPGEEVFIVPSMGNSGKVSGFAAYASSTYKNNYTTYGPWAAFDHSKNTFWNSSNDSTYAYDATTGVYLGTSSISVNTKNSGTQTIKGEYIQINMPNINTSEPMKTSVTQYGLRGRLECCYNSDGNYNARDPNTWYLLGWDGSSWNEIDYIENYNFPSVGAYATFPVTDKNIYSAFALIITVNGNENNNTNKRYSTQIASWNLYTNNIPAGSGDNAMTSVPNISTFKDCQSYAVNNDYKYFGMNNYQTIGTSQCLVSNDITMSKSYGQSAENATSTAIWASNTAGSDANMCFISATGNITLKNSSDQIVWQSPNAPTDCIFGGRLNTDTLKATYAANCNTQGYSVEQGNSTNIVKQLYLDANSPDSISIGINNTVLGDPASGCAKGWDTAYQCGNKWKSNNIGSTAEGQNFIYDCSTEAESCNFYAILQNDGNLCLYRGNIPSTVDSVWCSNTNGKQLQPNPQWVSSLGKYGRNYIKLNETLAVNEWIGSTNGSLQLLMQSDGNLVLYSSETVDGCVRNNDQMYGTEMINSLYQINQNGYRNNLGKVAYVDNDLTIHEYPVSMISSSNDYNIFPSYDSTGNDLSSVSVSTINDCTTSCNNNAECSGFVWQPESNICYLKNKNVYPLSERQQNNTTTLGVRKPTLVNTSSCSNDVQEIDTILYNNYTQGNLMTSDTTCGAPVVSLNNVGMKDYNASIEQLEVLGQQIADKMEKMYKNDNKLLNKMKTNDEQFKNDILKYKTIMDKIKNNNSLKEGMLNMQDINGMLNDTDLKVLQGNYKYILWSILAVGILTTTIHIMKKRI